MRPAVAEQIPIAITGADDRPRIRAVTEREPEFLALRFLGGDVEPQSVAADRRRFDLEDGEQAASSSARETSRPPAPGCRSCPLNLLKRRVR